MQYNEMVQIFHTRHSQALKATSPSQQWKNSALNQQQVLTEAAK